MSNDYADLYPSVRRGLHNEVLSGLDEYQSFLASVESRGMMLAPELSMEEWLGQILDYEEPITSQMLIEQAAMATEARHRALALVVWAELAILRRMVGKLEETVDRLMVNYPKP